MIAWNELPDDHAPERNPKVNIENPNLISLSDFDRLKPAIAPGEHIGIDTEFMRERTFFAQLCLIQIATSKHVYCIDPLDCEVADDAAASWRLLLESPWVLHSGRQDIEVVWQTARAMPVSVFDTQVASGLLGHQPQIGYANLVSELFDVQLAKTQTRADWSRRPLSGDMLRYAAEDVLYLLSARETLSERLDKLGRLDWALQDSADLLDKALYETTTDSAVTKLKGARSLRGPARDIAVRLAEWRENEALRRDRPRQWIIRDNVLLELAVRQPESKNGLLTIPGISERTVQRAHAQILAAVRDGLIDSGDYEPPPRPDEEQKALLKKMQARVSGCAEELGIAAELVAPKKELIAATLGDMSGRVFRGWRADLIGDELAGLAG